MFDCVEVPSWRDIDLPIAMILQVQQTTVQQVVDLGNTLEIGPSSPTTIVNALRTCDVTTVTAAASAFAQATIFQYGCNSFVQTVLSGQLALSTLRL